jgi:phage portal protein BeeE
LKEGVTETNAKAIMTEVKNAVTGSKNRNKSIVSNAIEDFKQMANNHKDMDFVAMQAFNSEKICSALGVPRVVLNYTEGVQVGNGETQYKKYIENTIRPEEMELNYIFTTILGEILPDVWFQVIDEHINDRKDKLEIVEKAINIGVYTRNEAREYLGDTKIEDNDLMDKYTVQNNVKLIEDLEFSITDMQNEQTSNIPT